MSLRPLYDMVVVRPFAATERTEGAIYVAGTTDTGHAEGVVVAVGPGTTDMTGKFITPQVKAGERVVYSTLRNLKFKEAGEDLLMMNLSEVLAVRE